MLHFPVKQYIIILIGLVFLGNPMSVHASSPYQLSLESTLLNRFNSEIIPRWQQTTELGVFTGTGELTIHYSYTQSSHPNQQLIFISPGRTEGYLKYKELVFDLSQQGYDVVVIDHRGQGLSDRTSSIRELGDVVNYQDYVNDMHQLYQIITRKKQYRHHFLLSHSMGGAIGALYLLNHPSNFDAAVFCSPMFGIQIAPKIPTWMAIPIAHLMTRINQNLSQGPNYSLGQGPYAAKPFDDNRLTHSRVRYQIFQQQYQATPEIQLGGPSYRWLEQSFIAMRTIAKQAPNLTTPSLILQSGGDNVVSNQAQHEFCEAHVQNDSKATCRLITIPEARHELFIEQDKQRNQALILTLEFFAQYNV